MRNPLATLDAVRLDDPAIDKDASDLDAYAKSRNPKHLKFHEGQKPVVFKVMQPSAAFTLDVLARLSGSGRVMYAFQACVHEVVMPDDHRLLAQKEHFSTGAGGMKIAHEKWLDQVRAKFGARAIIEMGNVASELGTMSDEELAGFSSPAGVTAQG
jgi:hypothetical protein